MASRKFYYRVSGRVEAGKWRARVKHNWIEYYLGDFDNKSAAEEREREFRVSISR